MAERREIAVDYLARVEGEGAMYLEVVDDEVRDLRLQIFEPPRFFEALLRGRHFSEAPDITARICGICPVAYQTSSCNAMEAAAGVALPDDLRALRRLLYCGEWIESHALHVYFLHAPDFLGYESAVAMASDFGEVVERGLRLKKLGNTIMTVLGGREIHPVNVRVGGFHRAPTRHDLFALVPELQWALDAAVATVRWVSGFRFPEFTRPYEFVGLHHPDRYAIENGRVVSSRGLDIDPAEWPQHFEEVHVERSNALHARRIGGGTYHVGPLARFNLHREQLTPVALAEAAATGLPSSITNPFHSIVVRAIEIVFACEEALAIIESYSRPGSAHVPADASGGTGHGVSEAPRGLLYHRYEVADDGLIDDAVIVPPTSQNQASIEEDLAAYVPGRLHLSDDELQWELEQAIRNYDPCISCATHFLDLTVRRAST